MPASIVFPIKYTFLLSEIGDSIYKNVNSLTVPNDTICHFDFPL